MHIEIVPSTGLDELLSPLCALLIRCVAEGASIGWVPPLEQTVAETYWQGRFEAVRAGHSILWAVYEDGTLIGSAQLALEQEGNGVHRADVQKVLVHSAYRQRGVGTSLMTHIENYARQNGRSLLVLDTRQGDPAEKLYQKVGFQVAGVIPQWAQNGEGGIDATVFYYKILA